MARSRAIMFIEANSNEDRPLTAEEIAIDLEEGSILVRVQAKAYGIPVVLAWIDRASIDAVESMSDRFRRISPSRHTIRSVLPGTMPPQNWRKSGLISKKIAGS